jgi:hypothetical protein
MNIATNYNPDPISGWIKVIADGKDYFISASSPLYPKAFDAFKAKDWESFFCAVDPAVKIKSLFAKYETVEVKNGLLYVDGDVVDSVVSDRLIQMLSNEVDVLPVLKFIYRLRLNPSSRAVNELYTFLEHKCLPFTESGTFLAYKAVRADYRDKYSNTFDNSVGNIVEMPRNKVDDNKDIGCSKGLHAGTIEYASHYAGLNDKIVLVEIDPADVVSIPTDCEFQKLRTCRYKVVGEFERPLTEPLYQSRFTTENDDEVDDYWDEDYDGNFACSGCGWNRHKCEECNYCVECCDCSQDNDGCMADPDPDKPKVEIQLELNLDNKMTNHWADERFQYLVMLPWLYSHRRPALGNALKNFYNDVDDLHQINPQFAILKQFTSDEDAYKIYVEYTNHK